MQIRLYLHPRLTLGVFLRICYTYRAERTSRYGFFALAKSFLGIAHRWGSSDMAQFFVSPFLMICGTNIYFMK